MASAVGPAAHAQGTSAPAATPTSPAPRTPHEDDFEAIEVDSQMEQPVISSTKLPKRAASVPAVVTVINAVEIQARGYTSLAEILRGVPGFYDVYDLVTHNVGVRGINGGAQASGNVLKLMIDGQPVDFRSTTGNFFGEELIPIDMIERVEIIRGPASALYGANAFLGVVNIIVKSGARLAGARVVGNGALEQGHPGGGGALIVGGSTELADFVAGASGFYFDRSGLTLPDSSPKGARYTLRGDSTGDLSRPKSVFSRLATNLPVGRLTLMGSLQNLDSSGEFQETFPLTHRTRVSLLNQNYRLSYNADLGTKVTLQAQVNYFSGGPTGAERFSIADPKFLLRREVGASGIGGAVELGWQVLQRLNFTGGADYVIEDHLTQTFDTVLTQPTLGADGSVLVPPGTVTPGARAGEHHSFRNIGAYLQGLFQSSDWSATVGGRVDEHNIYGANLSLRAGLVYAPAATPVSLKLLYGSSFKAPSAVQLYTQPRGPLDLIGNPELKAQTAQTAELAAAYGFGHERGEISVDLFGTRVNGRVEFVQRGLFLSAQNVLDETVAGGEFDLRYSILRELRLRFSGGVAHTVNKTVGPLLVGAPDVTNPLYPTYQANLFGDYWLTAAGLRVSVEVSYVGPRTSSQSNALVVGESYTLPAYVFTAATLSTAGRRLFGDRETSASLRVSDLLGQQWAEPGFTGTDTPTLGRTVMLTLVQQL